MNLRLELFVRDMEESIEFYTRVLGFEVLREDECYASLRCDGVTLGIGPVSRLPGEGGYFTRDVLDQRRGLGGVEIVLEVDDVESCCRHVLDSGYPVVEDLRERPWGLTDFRIADPDGYYLRLTSREDSEAKVQSEISP